MLLDLLKEWNSLSFSKPLIGCVNEKEIQFYLDTVFVESQQLYEKLNNCLTQLEPPGRLVYTGRCTEQYFNDSQDGGLKIESSRFKRYKLYFVDSGELEKKEFNVRIKKLIEIIQEINK